MAPRLRWPLTSVPRPPVLQDQWNHLVVVVSNGVTVTNVYGYLNGVLVAGPVASFPPSVPNDGFCTAMALLSANDPTIRSSSTETSTRWPTLYQCL